MKTRNGFVSNSSSSSFVVAFDKTPATKTELRDLMFDPDQTRYPEPYGDGFFPTEEVVNVVWGNMQEPATDDEWGGIDGSGPMTAEQVRSEFNNGYLEGEPDRWRSLSDFDNDDEWRASLDAVEKEREKYARKVADEFMGENPGKVFFRFHYSDNDGSFYCAMEHGNLFHKLTHFRISHH